MLNRYLDELKKIKILSREDEHALWQKAALGDETARQQLIISYQPLVFKVAAGFHLPKEECLELVQEGMVGVIEAAERFDCERGVAFSLFAVHRVRGRMVDYLRGQGAALSGADTVLDRLTGGADDPETVAEDNFIWRKVVQQLARLPEKEQKVLRGLYIEEASPGAIAYAINVNRAHIYRLHKQGIKRIRGMLARFMRELKW